MAHNLKRQFLLTAAILAFLGSPVFAEQLEPLAEEAASAAAQSNTPISSQAIVIEKQPMIDLLQSGKVDGIALQDPEGIYNFYKSQNFDYFWTDGEKAAGKTDKAINLVENSWEHGFNPDNYHLQTLKQREEQGEIANPLAFEILMSDAMARYAKDLTGMRIPARTLGEDTRSWRRGLGAEQALMLLTQNSNPEKAYKDLAPTAKLYPILQKELKDILEDMEKNPQANVKPIAFPGLIYPHKTHPAISLIRQRFDVKPEKDASPEFYDDKLIERLKSFQKANGLKPDGIIGQRTIEAINQGRRDRLVKVLANMERLRWMNPAWPDKYILVNVPAMTLWAFEQEKIMFEMPIIVGKSDWPTNSFKTDVTGIRFNPSWYVPPSIKTKDILPELRKNPDYLAKKNLELLYYTSDGAKPVSPRDIKWDQITEADFKNFAMIQNPGDENPLGKIRVLMPNQYNIYLHDTNSPDLFTKDYRALSHGCIRLAEPRRVANFILDKNGDWSEERLNNILSKKNTIEVMSTQPVPVFILYQTIWQDGKGDLIFGQDIYKNDEKLVAELAKRNKLPNNLN